jgi:hypothetical protein
MAIETVDSIVKALGGNSSRMVVDKASVANAVAGGFFSLWRSLTYPAQGAIPTTSALCNSALLGAVGFANQVDPASSYLAFLALTSSNSATSVEIHDRLAHNGGLVLNLATSQTTNLPLNLATLAVPADRVGDANYSDIQWWLEVYADGGATASNATINVTYNDDTTGNLAVIAVGGTLRTGRMLPLMTAVAGKYIKGINSVILSASTTVAGNFGFTATKVRANAPLPLANKQEIFDWASLGFPEIANNSCLSFIVMPTTTTTGTLRGSGKITHG